MIKVRIIPQGMSADEAAEYARIANEQHPGVSGYLDIDLAYSPGAKEPDEVELNIETEPIPFQRIRRITGYLVGDLSRFNNAKRREVADRVKHSTAPKDE